MCLHTILIDPADARRMYVAVSAAGAFRTEDGGESWHVATGGLTSSILPEPEAPIGHCVHKLAIHPSRPDTVFMQKHWDVCRTDDAGESWVEVSGNLPTDFGFPIAVHAHEPETIYVVPILSDAVHYPPDGKMRVYRSRSGGISGKRLRTAYHRVTAIWMSCAMPWQWIRSNPAVSISAPREVRCTPLGTVVTAGRPSPGTYPGFSPWRCKRSRDQGQGRAPGASASAGTRSG